MQPNRFLGDLLATLLDRNSNAPEQNDKRDIYALCHAMLSTEGEVSGFKLAASVLARYRGFNADEKRAFFQFLNDEFDVDALKLAALAQDYAKDPSAEAFQHLTTAAEPKRQELFRRLNQTAGATADLVSMRVDLLAMLKDAPELSRTNSDFVHLLRSWFNRGFLVLQQISWNTPAHILEKIVAYEAVHEIDDWDDLRRRVYPPDRRCFAFFHPAMPDEPLIFVEVALTQTVPDSIDDLLSEQRETLDPAAAKVATFYSISNCQKGLTGISFGNLLIKHVVDVLSQEFPQLQTFVTLSPIPGLTRWLKTQTGDDTLGPAAVSVLEGTAGSDVLRAMAAQYLLLAKRDDGLPLDPVMRFHLGNGAEVHDIHAGADTSENGAAQSRGAMVNYIYNLSQTEINHAEFAMKFKVKASKPVLALAKAEIKSKERTA
ncbi:malonyl-CoA decarboxylase [Pseudorhodobacter aquimaris]|uniref:malonyl-CoA decarboxylase n=1 Tax=Pseudorhodobacter aquimaris TaxID=687412 RepID=UPI00067CBAF4|nr:malonyl-CoA decarboxylase [Pseudorhodobacter aquimaris]